MKTFNQLFYFLIALLMLSIAACDDDKDDEHSAEKQAQFTSLSSPYLICANRNPGGVGFDFTYNSVPGGANNLDSTTVSDFDHDIVIKTVKGEKGDGSMGGAPYIKLSSGVEAINYSTIDTSCTGISCFNALTTSSAQAYTLALDDISFKLENLQTGATGKPLMSQLQAEFKKLVIGESWKTAAYNTSVGDEPIYIIQSKEGDLVKIIVTDFPANPAPSSTGYIAINWAYLN